MHRYTRYASTAPRLSHVHGTARSLSVITAHRDRDLAFSLKELRAWNFLQSYGAAFPQYGKGVDNVNDTAGASVGNSGRTQPRNVDVPWWRWRQVWSPDESKRHRRRIERLRFFHTLRPVEFVKICPIAVPSVTVTLSIDSQRVPAAFNGPCRYSYPTNGWYADQWSDFMHCFVNKLASDADWCLRSIWLLLRPNTAAFMT